MVSGYTRGVFLFPPRWTCRIEIASPCDLHKRMSLHTCLSTPVVLNRTGDGAKFHCYSNNHTASHQLKFFCQRALLAHT